MTPLNDPYSSMDLYNNNDFNELKIRIDSLEQKYKQIEDNLFTLEENTQENMRLLSEDIYHINSKVKNKNIKESFDINEINNNI